MAHTRRRVAMVVLATTASVAASLPATATAWAASPPGPVVPLWESVSASLVEGTECFYDLAVRATIDTSELTARPAFLLVSATNMGGRLDWVESEDELATYEGPVGRVRYQYCDGAYYPSHGEAVQWDHDEYLDAGTFIAHFEEPSLIVNSDGDDPDGQHGDGVCDTGEVITVLDGDEEAEVPECTLRAAIEEANTLGGDHDITVDIQTDAVPTIAPATPLPPLTGPTTLDASTQAGGWVELTRRDLVPTEPDEPAPEPAHGLVLDGQGASVSGLVVTGFAGSGIVLRGTGGHRVTGNRIGVEPDGTTPAGNGHAGVLVESAPNTIGGPGADANVIANNGDPIDPAEPEPGDEPDDVRAGVADLTGNVVITGGGADVGHNQLGVPVGVVAEGAIAATGVDVHDNVITATLGVAAIYEPGAPGRVQVRDNSIGTAAGGSATGATAIGVVVGGGGTGSTTVVGNTFTDVALGVIGAAVPGDASLEITGNTVSGSIGTLLLGAEGAVVHDNQVSTAAGVLSINELASGLGGNRFTSNEIAGGLGMLVVGDDNDEIRDNTFGGNGLGALLVAASQTAVTENHFGTTYGLFAAGPGLPAYGDNTYESNEFDEQIIGLMLIGDDGNHVVGNIFAETDYALFVSRSQASQINANHITAATLGMVLVNVGGTDLAANKISESDAGAMVLADEPTDADKERIGADSIDTDDESLFDAIFGSEDAQDALAWANAAQDVIEVDHHLIYQAPVSGARNTWVGNSITDNDVGVLLAGAVNANVFGGDHPELHNAITRNAAAGLVLSGDPGPQDVTVRGNSIFGNGTLGNDVLPAGIPDVKLAFDDGGALEADDWGPTPNDSGDEDAGPNGLQNHPILTRVPGDGTPIEGHLWAKPSTSYVIDVYANSACHVSGAGGGQTYLGEVETTTDPQGFAPFAFETELGEGELVTATATETGIVDGATSEFSRCAAVGTTGTTTTEPAEAGDDTLQVPDDGGLVVGDEIVINPGGDNEETATIQGFGSIILTQPLQFDHQAGEPILARSTVDPGAPGGGGGGGGGGTDPGSGGSPPADPDPDRPGELRRLAGADRIDTVIAIARDGFPRGADAVVLASDRSFADALVAGPLAAARRAPVLLTGREALDARVAEELGRLLRPGATVYGIGGRTVVGASVEAAVEAAGYDFVRLGGRDRYATALRVAREIGASDHVFVVTGHRYPDALAASAVAASLGGAIVLSDGASLPGPVAAFLAEAEAASVYAIGGPAAQAVPSAEALVGADRYATAVVLARRFVPAPKTVSVASGETFADGLTGGPHAGRHGPLLLVPSGDIPTEVARYLEAASLEAIQVYGGEVAVPTALAEALAALGFGA